MRRPAYTSMLLPILVMFVCGCETVVKDRPGRDPAAAQVWPRPPASARLAYLQSIRGPADLGIRKNLLQQLGEFITGGDPVQLVRPMAVAVAAGGIIYVADPGARGVHRFDRPRGRYQLLQGEKGQPLPSPVALAVAGDGTVYVSDSRLAAVLVITPNADAAVRLPLQAMLARPGGLAFDNTGDRLYLVDSGSHEVKVFRRDGALVNRIGRRGNGAGEFNFPTMIWMTAQQQLLVADSLNFRVQIFDASGNFLRQFGEAGDGAGYMAQPKGLGTDRSGNIYIVDSILHAVQIFSPDGDFLFKLGYRGVADGEFWLPAGIYIDPGDTIYIADSYNGRVQVLRHLGDPTP